VIPQLLPLQNLFSRTSTSGRPPEDDDAELDREKKEAQEKAAAEERAFARMRWAWAGLAVAGVVGWAMLSKFIRLYDEAEEGDDEYDGDGEGEEVEIDEDEEDEEDEED
jgi:flagellar biosynthesis/type III secretory pathway M-ring protein FliF/YscJ